MNSSLGDDDWQVLVLKDFKRVVGNHHPPAPGFFFRFSRSHWLSRGLFHLYFEVLCSKPLTAVHLGCSCGWGTWQDSCVRPPHWHYFAFFHKSVTLLPMFRSWSAGTPLLEAFPGCSLAVLSTSRDHAAHGSGRSLGLFAHGPGWIGPFVFFRLFLWLSRSFWILSLPAGYLQSLVAFHYINKFTVYYLVAARPGPRSVLYPLYASGGSWLHFFFFFFNKCK